MSHVVLILTFFRRKWIQACCQSHQRLKKVDMYVLCVKFIMLSVYSKNTSCHSSKRQLLQGTYPKYIHNMGKHLAPGYAFCVCPPVKYGIKNSDDIQEGHLFNHNTCVVYTCLQC